jgi:spore coat polysaccharide biosynthesis protein SpsF
VRVLVVVQARMGSSRLPGKVTRELAGRPMLGLLLERVGRCRMIDHLMVATSTRAIDDPVVSLADAAGVQIVRGSEVDVLARFESALRAWPADHIVRLTGDCPLLDPAIVDAVVAEHCSSGASYTSNTLVRTYPDGLDVEVLRADALYEAAALSTDRTEREHVTPFVYRRPERYPLRFHRGPRLLGDERWTVDTAADLDVLRDIVGRLPDPVTATWEDVLAQTGTRARCGDPCTRVVTSDDRDRLLAWRNEPATVATSGTRRTVGRLEHERWFASLLSGGPTRMWIAEMRGQPVGHVRVDVRSGTGEVSLGVASEARGRGLSGFLLSELERHLAADAQVHTLVARVRPENEPSRRAFMRAGYATTGEGDDGLLKFVRAR